MIAVDLNLLLGDFPPQDIVFALAAGEHFRGVHVAGIVLNKGATPPSSIRPPLRADGYPGEREFTLSEFLASFSGVVDGRTFKRREVIKYIANVKGGVHLSTQQRKAEAKLIARLGKIEKKLRVNTTDGLLVETVAIGQALGNSDDARWFSAQVFEHV